MPTTIHTHNPKKPSPSIIDVQPKKVIADSSESASETIQSINTIPTTGTATQSNEKSTLITNSTSSSLPNKPQSASAVSKPLSSHKIIAFFQRSFRKAKAFYTRYKTPINIALALITVAGITGATIVGFWLVNIWNNESSLAGLGQQPNQSSVVYAADGTTELFRFYDEENREVVDLSAISPNMQQAIIALEDENFYYNESGIPWSNLFGAAFKCAITIGDDCRGASGLSQQLIKNVKKDNESSVDRNVRELFTAVKLNSESTHDEILSLYLNWVPFGRNAYGVEQGAKLYFGKTATELTLPESCYLASMVQRPSYYESGINSPEGQAFADLTNRKNACLDKIYSKQLKPDGQKLITTQEELDTLKAQPVVFLPRGSTVKYPHFKDYVSQEISKFVNEQDLLTGGYTIITTLDPATQDAVQKSINDRAQQDIYSAGANNAAAVVLDGPTSEVRAMVGSLDYNNVEIDGQVNVALAPRQPGSSIKPYVYAASFKQGLYPGSLLLDAPTTFEPGYTPKNFSGGFSGPISVRLSLANSYNIPAVKAAYLSAATPSPNATQGIAAVFDTTTAMGVEFPCIPSADGAVCNTENARDAYRSRCGISASLGGCEVSLLSHVNGINTFAQDGVFRQATPFKQIIDNKGEDVYAKRQASNNPVYQKNEAAIDPLIARQINSILSDYGARYRAFGNLARKLELEGWTGANAVAAKTGTTNDVKDTWTVGYSPYYTVAVWVGNTDSTPLNQNSSSVGTTSGIWNDTMVYLHANKEKKGFSKEGLQSIRIDPTTGLPDPNGSTSELITPTQLAKLNTSVENLKKIPEYSPTTNTFLANGTINIRSKVKINKLDGKIAVDGKTLPENIEEKDFNQLVAEFPAWQNTADDWMNKTPELYTKPPTEKSDQDQVADKTLAPSITSNLDADKQQVSTITIQAQPQGVTTKTIVLIELLIDGTIVDSAANTDTLKFTDIADYTSGSYTILIRATDSFGTKSEKAYSQVTFKELPPDPTPLTSTDIGNLELTCDAFTIGDIVTECSFDLPTDTSLPSQFSVRIGSTGNTSCTQSTTGNPKTATCTNIPIPIIPGDYPIKARVSNSGSYIDTLSTYTVT